MYLTTLDGKLRLNKCGGVLVESESEEDPCCCDCCKTYTCSATESGTTAGYGWDLPRDETGAVDVKKIPNKLPITVRFLYPDSANCGGSFGASSGTLNGCFSLKEDTQIRVSVSGLVEQQNSGYDFGRVTAPLQATISSFNRGLGCAMTQSSDSQTGLILAGISQYQFTANTVDGLFHAGMIHTFTIEKA